MATPNAPHPLAEVATFTTMEPMDTWDDLLETIGRSPAQLAARVENQRQLLTASGVTAPAGPSDEARWYGSACRPLGHYGHELPQLCLGIEVGTWTEHLASEGANTWTFAGGRTWYPVIHRSGGTSGNRTEWILTVLQPRRRTWDGIHRLVHDRRLHLGPRYRRSVEDLVTYRQVLNERLGVDCNHAYASFEPGLFPIDVTDAHLTTLTGTAPDLTNLLHLDTTANPDPFDDIAVVQASSLFTLMILGPNPSGP